MATNTFFQNTIEYITPQNFYDKKGLINLFDSALFDCLYKLMSQRLNVKILNAKNTPQNKYTLSIHQCTATIFFSKLVSGKSVRDVEKHEV